MNPAIRMFLLTPLIFAIIPPDTGDIIDENFEAIIDELGEPIVYAE